MALSGARPTANRGHRSSFGHKGFSPIELARRPCSSITTSTGKLISKNHPDRASMRLPGRVRGLSLGSLAPLVIRNQATNWLLSNGLEAFRVQPLSSQSSPLLCRRPRCFPKPPTYTPLASSISLSRRGRAPSSNRGIPFVSFLGATQAHEIPGCRTGFDLEGVGPRRFARIADIVDLEAKNHSRPLECVDSQHLGGPDSCDSCR